MLSLSQYWIKLPSQHLVFLVQFVIQRNCWSSSSVSEAVNYLSVVSVRPDPAQNPGSPGAEGSLLLLLLLAVRERTTLDHGHLSQAQVRLQPQLRADGEEADVEVEGTPVSSLVLSPPPCLCF